MGITKKININKVTYKRAENAFIDTLACILSGVKEKQSKVALKYCLENNNSGKIKIFGGGKKLSISAACFLHGVRSASIDFDDYEYVKDKIIILDKFTYSSNRYYIQKVIKNKKNVYLLKGDICNKKLISKILNKYNINKIINFAAETHVDNSIEDPKPFIDTNIYGAFNLLNCARLHWLKSKINNHHFHQISTDEVYGSLLKNQNKFKENSRFNPSSPYSSSKASSDLIALSFFKTYKMNITISNTSNNFGPFIHKEKLIPKIILSILNNKKFQYMEMENKLENGFMY